MNSPEAPSAPQVANTQGAYNKETAIAQQGLNMVNQNTPSGSLSYKQIGTWADGTPRFEANTSLSPDQQALYNKSNQLQGNLANLGIEQSGRLSGLMNAPLDLSNEATESRLMQLGRSRLDPALQQRRESTEQQLFNRGVRPGTEAYDRAMLGVSQGENDAYNQLLLTGRNQAVNEALTERSVPLNEILSVAGGGQVQMPSFSSTPQAGVAPVDYAGAENSQYQGQLSQYNNNMSGLFGLGAAGIGGWAMSG